MSIAIGINAVGYFSAGPTPSFLLEKGELRNHPLWTTAFYFHVAAAVVCLSVGPLLMVSRLVRSKRWRGREIHTVLGYVYLNAVLWVAAPMGLIISPVSKGGALAAAGFIVTGILWWYTTWRGYTAIRGGDTRGHICFMVRSYAIALSAIAFRIIQVALSVVLDNYPNYIASVWLSLLVSVWLSEACIARHFPDQCVLRWSIFSFRNLSQGKV